MTALVRASRVVLAASTAAMLLLTFVWPLAVPAEPAHPGFRIAAMATFVVFFVALAALLAGRLARGR